MFGGTYLTIILPLLYKSYLHYSRDFNAYFLQSRKNSLFYYLIICYRKFSESFRILKSTELD
jgi:hypothetical protein